MPDLNRNSDRGGELSLPDGDARGGGGTRRQCDRCGRPVAWLVVMRYDLDSPAGRLLIYCEECRRDRNHNHGAVLPWSVFALDPAAVLTLLYRGGATLAHPDLVAERLGVPPAEWTEVARQALAERGIDLL